MGYRNPGHPTPCPHCSAPKILPSEKAMVAHVHARHPSLPPFACLAGCGRFFKSKPGALKHSGTCKPPAPQHHRNSSASAAEGAEEENSTPPAAGQEGFRATRKECPTCGAWLASAASLARHRRGTACGGRKRVWVGEGADPREAAAAGEGSSSMRHGNRWRRSWVVVDESQDEEEVRGREPGEIAGKKRRFVEERQPVEGEYKRVKQPVKRAPRAKNKEKKQEITVMLGVWSLQKWEDRQEYEQEQEKVHKQEEFKEHVWNLQMQEAKEDDIQEKIQEQVKDKDEDDEEMVAIRFPMAGKRLPGTVSPPRKTVSGKTVPGKTVPGNTVPRKTVPRKTVPQRKGEEGETEDSETEESEVKVTEWEDESDDDGEESEWDDEDYM